MSLYPVNLDLISDDPAHDPPITPRCLIFHTAVSSAHGSGPAAPINGLEWHFYIDEDGSIWQRRNTNIQADANYLANDFAISCETWDNADPEHTPWTPAQVSSIIRLCHLANTIDHVPLTRPAAWNGSGIGYHRQFPQWNNPYHSCPGDLRAHQFDFDIWPQVIAAPPPTPPKRRKVRSMIVYHVIGGGYLLWKGGTDFVIIDNDSNHDNLAELVKACGQSAPAEVTPAMLRRMGANV